MQPYSKTFYLLLLLLFAFACGEDPVVTPDPEPEPEPPVVIKAGLSWSPEEADADKELTIWFKPRSATPLYNYQGDVYIHTGVISEGVWQFVPAGWDENLPKCKMTKVEGELSTWTIPFSPSIRQWFGSGETPVNKLGIVIRSADGSKQTEDLFIPVTDTKFKAFQPAAIKSGTMPSGLQHGINIRDNSTVTLVLYDKDKNGARKNFAHVVGDFNNWTLSNDEKSQMFRDEAAGCWWITIPGLDPTKEYAFQYYVGDTDADPIRMADPYARKILDPSNDKYISPVTYPGNMDYPKGAIGIVSVFQTRPESYTWQVPNFEVPSRDNLVIYEMLLRDFTTTGDLNGAMEKLNYLQSLGVNAIELMPVQEFDGNDSWGYNPCFYFAMDKAYGTDRMYKQFIDECHKRGMAVIFDVVYNHATGAHPFAKMWWDAANNKTASNNPYFNVDAPHPYSVFHDFNHESPLVRDFVKRNLEFLLQEYNIDGFRFDLTKGFTQNRSTEATAGNYDASRVDILKDYNSAIKAVKSDAHVILEHFCDDKEERELGDAGMMVWRNMNWQYCQSAMGWNRDNCNFTDAYYGANRPANSLVSYMESHDEERAAYKQGQWGNGILKTDPGARMNQLATNAAFFLTVPGPKMIWQFGEMGYDVSIEQNGRTGRKPTKWDYLEVPQRKGLHDTYSKLISLRFDHPELFNATATLDWKVTESFWESGRFITLSSFGGAKQVVVIGNFTNDPLSATFPETGTWYDFMAPGEPPLSATSATNITVAANSFKMYTSFTE
ncbi:alpha-amylase family glycosyl hydrolase [Proteiniphilum sp. X52]|uniref:alpha-amylase family glycosyl hydrolase n=1 Tax=Proteiniphilum sp. X52 TaxID=2382159 RepID=UPI000F0A6F13|nr:alpha-amylase family glycosyl hydrolase [Proteiniphilum sp. X52]RNC66827.1 alpha-amylase [Proteiniphilum sp. X52]